MRRLFPNDRGLLGDAYSKVAQFFSFVGVSDDKIRNGVFDARNTPRFVFRFWKDWIRTVGCVG